MKNRNRVITVRRYSLPKVVATAFLFCLLPALVSAQAPPSADTFVSSATPTANYGPSIVLVVQPGATSLLRFNLATLAGGPGIEGAPRFAF